MPTGPAHFATLFVTSSVSNRDQVLPISKHEEITVGRDSKNTLQLNELMVSSIHLRLHTIILNDQIDPLCYLTDLSTNGTYFKPHFSSKFERMHKHKPMLLCDRDTFEIPRTAKFTFRQTCTQFASTATKEKLYSQIWKFGGRVLGCGTYGTIEMVHRRDKTGQAACKVIDKHAILKLKKLDFSREINVLKSLAHPNIISTYEINSLPDKLFIVSELLAGGDLFTRLHLNESCLYGGVRVPDAEKQVAWITHQILRALEYLHARGVAHRDIKLENVLLSGPESYSRAVLTDFGMSRQLVAKRMTSCVGTVSYQAPEMFSMADSSNIGYGLEVDLWSLGCTLHDLLLGAAAFQFDDLKQYMRPESYILDFEDTPTSELSLTARDMLRCLLRTDPKRRMTVNEAFQHPWLKQFHRDFAKFERRIHQMWTAVSPIVHTYTSAPGFSARYRFVPHSKPTIWSKRRRISIS